jgi:hypothetical protein
MLITCCWKVAKPLNGEIDAENDIWQNCNKNTFFGEQNLNQLYCIKKVRCGNICLETNF